MSELDRGEKLRSMGYMKYDWIQGSSTGTKYFTSGYEIRVDSYSFRV